MPRFSHRSLPRSILSEHKFSQMYYTITHRVNRNKSVKFIFAHPRPVGRNGEEREAEMSDSDSEVPCCRCRWESLTLLMHFKWNDCQPLSSTGSWNDVCFIYCCYCYTDTVVNNSRFVMHENKMYSANSSTVSRTAESSQMYSLPNRIHYSIAIEHWSSSPSIDVRKRLQALVRSVFLNSKKSNQCECF